MAFSTELPVLQCCPTFLGRQPCHYPNYGLVPPAGEAQTLSQRLASCLLPLHNVGVVIGQGEESVILGVPDVRVCTSPQGTQYAEETVSGTAL